MLRRTEVIASHITVWRSQQILYSMSGFHFLNKTLAAPENIYSFDSNGKSKMQFIIVAIIGNKVFIN